MDRRIFETYVETQLAPTLRPGDVVVLDNLPAHKSAAAEQAVRAMGAWLLFLPPYSPDLNPIEMAFAKLKALLRARAVRTIDALWRAIGEICDLFSPQECQNWHRQVERLARDEKVCHWGVFSGRGACVGDLTPNRKGSLTRSAAEVSSGEFGERDVEEVCDLIVNRQKLLRLPG